MMPKWHVLYGFILSILLIEFFDFSPIASLIVFLSSVFIDLDHVLIYYIETKNLNPFNFWRWSMKKKNAFLSLDKIKRSQIKQTHFILHGVEFIFILLILSLFFSFFGWVLIGVVFHLILDIVNLVYNDNHLSIKTSQIWLWQRNKNKKYFYLS